jgi:hypothetical protein
VSGRTLTAALVIAISACALRDSFPDDVRRPRADLGRCAGVPGGETICLEARLDCRPGAPACEPAIDDPVGQLRDLAQDGRRLSFRAGAMSSVSRANHFQSVQRLPGDGPARFVVTRETARREETDIGIVESSGPRGGERVARAWDTGTDHTHAGGTQLVGRMLVVPLERGSGGSAVHLYDLSSTAAPRLIATIDHRGARGERLSEAGAAGMIALADGRYLLVVGTRHSRRLDFYLSGTGDLAAAGWRHLDRWDPSELETAIGDRRFGAYQSLHLLAGKDGALYLLGSHRQFFHSDWLDLHQLAIRRGPGGAPAIHLVKVGKKHLECGAAAADHCNLDAGTGLFIDGDGRLRIYAIGYAAARVAFRPPREQAAVHMVEFVSRGVAGSRAERDRAAALRPDRSPRR